LSSEFGNLFVKFRFRLEGFSGSIVRLVHFLSLDSEGSFKFYTSALDQSVVEGTHLQCDISDPRRPESQLEPGRLLKQISIERIPLPAR